MSRRHRARAESRLLPLAAALFLSSRPQMAGPRAAASPVVSRCRKEEALHADLTAARRVLGAGALPGHFAIRVRCMP